jgi:hypothetical protein
LVVLEILSGSHTESLGNCVGLVLVGLFIFFAVGLIVTALVFWNQIFIVFFGVILVLCSVVNV